jgi:phosphatidylglycerol:prolipoprotein diacylglycerol transferase
MFLFCYGVFRFMVELVREPDAQLGYLAFGWVTMGQVLSLPMVFLGIWMFWWAHRKAETKFHAT